MPLHCSPSGWLTRKFFASVFVLAAQYSAFANDATSDLPADTEPERAPGWREIWAGVDARAGMWLAYGGMTVAPWSTIHTDGFRVRSSSGYGQYAYNWNAATRVKVTKTTADAMVGYQHQFGDLTAKVFIGMAIINNDFDIPSRAFRTSDVDWGAKGAVELWLNITPRVWSALDLSYADTRATAAAHLRVGYRVFGQLSLGLEGRLDHSDNTGYVQDNAGIRHYCSSRVGAFARFEWDGGEISAAGGWAGNVVETRSSKDGEFDLLRQPSAYGTVNVVMQY
jgi:Cellulose biosynthesis protein BcsS